VRAPLFFNHAVKIRGGREAEVNRNKRARDFDELDKLVAVTARPLGRKGSRNGEGESEGRADESKLRTGMAEGAGMGKRLDEDARRHQSGTVAGAGWKRAEEVGFFLRDRPIRGEDEKFGEKT
jgi:hypothetical protein